jgi:hypothetical protein
MLAFCTAVALAPAARADAAEWPNTPSVSCDTIVIDPPTWIKVTFTGTVNGNPFELSAFYGGDGSHDAHINIADLTAAGGRMEIVVTATSKFLGTSHTARVTIDCPATTAQGGNQGTTAPSGAEPQSAASGTQSSREGVLPFTGAFVLRLALIGLVALAIGLGASRVRRRRRTGRRSRDA